MATPDKSQTDKDAEVKVQEIRKVADKVQEKMHKSFQNVTTAILTIATFAAGVTFNILLKPADAGGPPRAVIYLSYANSLFCAAIMGCALIMLSIELVGHTVSERVRQKIIKTFKHGEKGSAGHSVGTKYPHLAMAILSFEIVFVGTILYVAIFFLLYSTSLFLGVRGPLILALVLYGFFGLVLFLSMVIFVLYYTLLAWTEDW